MASTLGSQNSIVTFVSPAISASMSGMVVPGTDAVSYPYPFSRIVRATAFCSNAVFQFRSEKISVVCCGVAVEAGSLSPQAQSASTTSTPANILACLIHVRFMQTLLIGLCSRPAAVEKAQGAIYVLCGWFSKMRLKATFEPSPRLVCNRRRSRSRIKARA